MLLTVHSSPFKSQEWVAFVALENKVSSMFIKVEKSFNFLIILSANRFFTQSCLIKSKLKGLDFPFFIAQAQFTLHRLADYVDWQVYFYLSWIRVLISFATNGRLESFWNIVASLIRSFDAIRLRYAFGLFLFQQIPNPSKSFKILHNFLNSCSIYMILYT